MSDVDRNCGNCEFSHNVQIIGSDGKIEIGQKRIECLRMPPTPVLLPTGTNVLQLQSLFPVVHDKMFCAEHRRKANGIAADNTV